MKKLSTVSWNAGRGTAEVGTVQAGSHCPSGGFGQPDGVSAEAIYIAAGSIMPSSGGGGEASRAPGPPVALDDFPGRTPAPTGSDTAPEAFRHSASKFHVSEEKILDRSDHSA
jgi:hypothetical protein